MELLTVAEPEERLVCVESSRLKMMRKHWWLPESEGTILRLKYIQTGKLKTLIPAHLLNVFQTLDVGR